MRKVNLIIALIVTLSTTAFGQETFTLTSNDFSGQTIKSQEFNGFGCTGGNVSPQLAWENAPEGTKSFAITMYDPDAPTGSGWWHWVIFDIPSNIEGLLANAGNPTLNLLPETAIQSMTDYGAKGYGGPCPPEDHGMHQYIITIHALKTETLGLEENTNPAVVGYYLSNNVIAKASIVAYYERKKN